MRTPALAIGWSLWARYRAGHAVVLAMIALCALGYRLFNSWIPERMEDSQGFLNELPLTILPMVLSLIWTLYVFAQTENDAKKGFTGFPVRMFALPVRTRFLVTCHMAYGITAILLVYLAWAWLVFAPVGVHFALRWPLLLLAMAMISFQAAVWGLASFPWIRAGVIGAGGLFLGPLIAIASLPEFGWQRREPVYALWTLAALPFAYGAGWAMAGAERLGGWQPWEPVRRLVHRIFDALLLRRESFRWPGEALAWLEWRRKGWLSTLWLALSIAGAMALLPVAALGMMGLPPSLAVAVMFPWPLFLGRVIGSLLARPDLTGEVALSPFHAIKPITNAQIVLIKLKVAAGITVAAWVLSAPLAWAVARWPKWQEIWIAGDLLALSHWWTANLGWMALLGWVALVTTWNAMVETLSLGLTGKPRVITVRSMLGMLLFVGAMSVGIWFLHRPASLARLQSWFYLGAGLLMAIKFRGVFHSFREVRRHLLATPEQFRILLACWGVVALSVLGGAAWIWFNLPLPRPLILALAALLWPAGELPQAIVNLSANRTGNALRS